MGNSPLIPDPAVRIARAVSSAGGRVWIVGGWVRDYMLGRASKDLDIEVSGLTSEHLHDVLADLGTVHAVGRSFPIFKFNHADYQIDLSLPRKHHQPDGPVQVDPQLSLKESAQGRDLCMNAMALDPLSGKIEDPFGGQQDIEDHILRAVDIDRFGEDPLRVFRIARFAAQLDFTPDAELQQGARKVDVSSVAPERVGWEIWKLFTAPYAMNGVHVGCKIGLWSRIIDEIDFDATSPEIMGLERWQSHRQNLGSTTRSVTVALGILLHRISKDEREHVLNRLDIHRRDGFDMRAELLLALARWRNLSTQHDDVSLRWASERGELVISLGIAQALNPHPSLAAAWNRASEMGILFCPLMPLVLGRDLIERGFSSGPSLGQALRHIRAAQLDGRISTPEEAFKLAENELNGLMD